LNIDFKKAVLALILLSLPLVSIQTQKDPLRQGWYDKPFSFLASLLQGGFFQFTDGVRGTTRLYLDLINIKKENESLRAQNALLQTQLLALDEIMNENARLNQLMDFQARTKMTLVAARIMSRDLMSDHNTIQINKGSNHGLKSGMAVISVDGVVGHIFKTEMWTSQVLLLTDRYSVVDGLIARSRARGIVEGKNSNLISLRYIEKSEDVQVGDLVVTSGLDNIFPKGFPIAKVESVEDRSYSVSLRVELSPVVNPNKIEEVFIIMDAKHFDFQTVTAKAE
jgi:rod shape-determining protein MreC